MTAVIIAEAAQATSTMYAEESERARQLLRRHAVPPGC